MLYKAHAEKFGSEGANHWRIDCSRKMISVLEATLIFFVSDAAARESGHNLFGIGR